MSRDPVRCDDYVETKVFYSVCVAKECGEESDSQASEEECPNSCAKCGGDVEIESDWV